MSKRKLSQSVLFVIFIASFLAQAAYCKGRVVDLKGLELKEKLSIVNPKPKELPTLNFTKSYSWVTFPNIPNSKSRAIIYECPVEYLGVRDLGNGKAEVYHRVKEYPHIIVITTITPEKYAVEYLATLALEKGSEDKDLPSDVPALNLCWSVGPSSTFRDNQSHYSEFIKRCFLFTENGRTYLNTIPRKPMTDIHPKDPDKNPDHYRNHPYAWVQTYNCEWQETTISPNSRWCPNQTTHHVANIIGVRSIDKDYLAAIAGSMPYRLGQAWHTCLHAHATWQPESAPLLEREWKNKIYMMPDDTYKLMKNAEKDFPKLYGPVKK